MVCISLHAKPVYADTYALRIGEAYDITNGDVKPLGIKGKLTQMQAIAADSNKLYALRIGEVYDITNGDVKPLGIKGKLTQMQDIAAGGNKLYALRRGEVYLFSTLAVILNLLTAHATARCIYSQLAYR